MGQTGSHPSLKTSNHYELNESCQTNIRERPVSPRVPRKLGVAGPRLGVVRWLLFLLDLLSLLIVALLEMLRLLLVALLCLLSPGFI